MFKSGVIYCMATLCKALHGKKLQLIYQQLSKLALWCKQAECHIHCSIPDSPARNGLQGPVDDVVAAAGVDNGVVTSAGPDWHCTGTDSSDSSSAVVSLEGISVCSCAVSTAGGGTVCCSSEMGDAAAAALSSVWRRLGGGSGTAMLLSSARTAELGEGALVLQSSTDGFLNINNYNIQHVQTSNNIFKPAYFCLQLLQARPCHQVRTCVDCHIRYIEEMPSYEMSPNKQHQQLKALKELCANKI